jgi:putative ABC transport system substrate-binding protein
VLVAGGDAAALAVKSATRDVPVVFVTVADPVGIGLVTSLARPGSNITGLSDLHGDLVSKRLDMLKQMAPATSRVAVLLNPGNPAHPIQLKSVETAARAMGLAVLPVPLEPKGPDDVERAFAVVKTERPGGMMVLGDRLLGAHAVRIAELIVKNRLPAVFTQRSWVEAGGLMSYGADFSDLYRRAATYVDKVLKGAKPADLPIEQPTKFVLVVNTKTARTLGLTIPPALLARADEIVG